MSEQPTQGRYWTLVDISSSGCTKTYERQLPHGTLVRVATHYPTGCAVSVVFVPHPPRQEAGERDIRRPLHVAVTGVIAVRSPLRRLSPA